MNPEELQLFYAACMLGCSVLAVAFYAWRTKP